MSLFVFISRNIFSTLLYYGKIRCTGFCQEKLGRVSETPKCFSLRNGSFDNMTFSYNSNLDNFQHGKLTAYLPNRIILSIVATLRYILYNDASNGFDIWQTSKKLSLLQIWKRLEIAMHCISELVWVAANEFGGPDDVHCALDASEGKYKEY